jgi:hypothetical protein
VPTSTSRSATSRSDALCQKPDSTTRKPQRVLLSAQLQSIVLIQRETNPVRHSVF